MSGLVGPNSSIKNRTDATGDRTADARGRAGRMTGGLDYRSRGQRRPPPSPPRPHLDSTGLRDEALHSGTATGNYSESSYTGPLCSLCVVSIMTMFGIATLYSTGVRTSLISRQHFTRLHESRHPAHTAGAEPRTTHRAHTHTHTQRTQKQRQRKKKATARQLVYLDMYRLKSPVPATS